MNIRGRRFETDRANGKIAGVCAGLGETLGVDPNVIRIGFVLAAVLGSFIAAMIVYGVLAMAGSPKNSGRREHALAKAESKFGRVPETDERVQAHQRRMREIDTFVAGSNSRLAREIESLRQD